MDIVPKKITSDYADKVYKYLNFDQISGDELKFLVK
jgi:hypothetical protein